MKLKDLTGKRFGKWLVIRRTQTSRKHTIWECECECGNKKDVYSTHLIQGNSQGCSDCFYKKNSGANHKQWKGYGDLSGDFWDSIKRGASGSKSRRKSVAFEISIEYAWNLFLEQNRKCALSGQKLMMNYRKRCDHTASLDRIDNSEGYVEGNVQWVHKDVNMMKRTYDQDYFIEMCKKIASYR